MPHLPAKITAIAGPIAAGVVMLAMQPESQLFGRTIVSGNDPSEVALTYDDGPNDRATPQLLEILARHNARATFFMVGRHVKQHPEIVRQVAAAGHLIANHTWTHPWLIWRSPATIREELRSTSQILEDAIGQPIRYFRAPHGARHPYIIRAARELGMATVQWNAMGYDWEPITARQIVANLNQGQAKAASNHRGTNLLLHDGDGNRPNADRSNTLTATELLLQRFTAEGKRTVTVDEWDNRANSEQQTPNSEQT